MCNFEHVTSVLVRISNVSELEKGMEKGRHGKLLNDISPHQYIWSQHCSDLQPADVGQTGDRVWRRRKEKRKVIPTPSSKPILGILVLLLRSSLFYTFSNGHEQK